MSVDAVLLVTTSVGLMLATAAWIALPLLRGEVPADPPDARAVALLARREASLATLRDLDSDFADGRLEEADYKESRERTLVEGAAALAALDRLNDDLSGQANALAAEVEKDVAAARDGAARDGAAADGTTSSVAPAEASEAAETAEQPETAEQTSASGPAETPTYCRQCGRQAGAGDRFCAGCGQALDTEQVTDR